MRNLILATVALASLAAPLAAQAYPGEIRNDRREVQEQREDLRDARRSGDPRAIRDERRDVRDANRELRSDVRDRQEDRRDDRGDWRRDHRDGDYRRDGYRDDRRAEWRAERRYDAGRFYYPRGYSYRAWNVGGFVPRAYWGERYWVGRPVNYGLPYAVGGTRWVRVGPDALLIRTYNGAVLRVVRGIFY